MKEHVQECPLHVLKLISMCHTAIYILYDVVCSRNLAEYIDG